MPFALAWVPRENLHAERIFATVVDDWTTTVLGVPAQDRFQHVCFDGSQVAQKVHGEQHPHASYARDVRHEMQCVRRKAGIARRPAAAEAAALTIYASSMMPSQALFSVYTKGFFAKLEEQGETELLGYLRRWHYRWDDQRQMWDAPWRCGFLGPFPAGRTPLTVQQAMEGLWKALKEALPRRVAHVSLVEAFSGS